MLRTSKDAEVLGSFSQGIHWRLTRDLLQKHNLGARSHPGVGGCVVWGA